MSAVEGIDVEDANEADGMVVKVVKDAPEMVRRIVQADPIVPIAPRRTVHLSRKTDEDWLKARNGRWVNMINAMRQRNETEHRLKETISNVQTVSDMCQTLEYALRTEATLGFLKGIDSLPKFCLILDSGDEHWFLHSSHSTLIGLLLNLDCEHSNGVAFEKAFIQMLDEFETLYRATTQHEQLSLVLFYAQARGSPCCRRYFELRVIGRSCPSSNPSANPSANGDVFDVDVGHRLITSHCPGDLRRYVGRARQSIEMQRLKHHHVPHVDGQKQGMDSVVGNQLKCMLHKMRSHFIYVDIDEEQVGRVVDRIPRPESPPTSTTDSVSGSTTDSSGKEGNGQPVPPSSACRRCQTTLDVMRCKTQLYQRTLDEAQANLNETVERETAKTRQIEQKLQAMELLNQNLTECHHDELAKMRETVEKCTGEIACLKHTLAEKDAQLKQNELILDEATSSSTSKKKRRGGKKRGDEADLDADETRLDTLQLQVQQLRGQLSNVEDECKELQAENNEAYAKVKELQDAASDYTRRETELQERCNALHEQTNTLQAASDSALQDVQTLKASQQKTLKAMTKKHETEKRQTEDLVKTLTTEHDAVVRQLEALTKQSATEALEAFDAFDADASGSASSSETKEEAHLVENKTPPSPPLKGKRVERVLPKTQSAPVTRNAMSVRPPTQSSHPPSHPPLHPPLHPPSHPPSHNRYMANKGCPPYNLPNRTPHGMQMRPAPTPSYQPPTAAMMGPMVGPMAGQMPFYGMQGMQRPAPPYNYMQGGMQNGMQNGMQFNGFHPPGHAPGSIQFHGPGFAPEYGTMYEGAPGVPSQYNGTFSGQWAHGSAEYYTESYDAPLDETQLLKTMAGGYDEASHVAKEMLDRLKTMAKTQQLSAEEIHKMLRAD